LAILASSEKDHLMCEIDATSDYTDELVVKLESVMDEGHWIVEGNEP
jgi:hypothetical protein